MELCDPSRIRCNFVLKQEEKDEGRDGGGEGGRGVEDYLK